MSVLYCTIPHFAATLARRDDPDCGKGPLVLIGPEERVFDVSIEAQACGVVPGMTAHTAQVRCPKAHLLEADLPRCREERETLLELLEGTSPKVEPHGWGAAYVDLGDLVRDYGDAVSFCREVGRQVRRELGQALQPALGWNSSKFTAQAAGRRTRPGHLQAVDAVRERDFLQPLPVSLLPLDAESRQRLCFLGLRTLGQYAALPRAAVWQQFGRAGRVAQRCARGEDDRPIVSRQHAPQLAADIEFETPLVEQERLLAALKQMLSPLLAELQGNLQACGLARLAVRLDDGSTQERERAFLFPLSEAGRIVRAVAHLLDGMGGQQALPRIVPSENPGSGIIGLEVTLSQIQDAVAEQLTLFPLTDGALEAEKKEKLREVERYLAARFGASPFGNSRLRRPVMVQPGAPLPEWRVGWQAGDGS